MKRKSRLQKTGQRRVNRELFTVTIDGFAWRFVLVPGLLFFREEGDDAALNTAAVTRPDLMEVHVASQQDDIKLMWGLGNIICSLLRQHTELRNLNHDQEAA